MQKTIRLILSLAFLSPLSPSYAYEVESHRVIAERAAIIEVNGSSLERTLQDELGIAEGLEAEFEGRSIQRWIGEGAVFEDEPDDRVVNHFHNPLLP